MTIQNLRQLIDQFTPREQMLIRYALKSKKEDGEENKSLRLFEYVVDHKNKVSRNDASSEIYQARPDTRINKLISRLWEKILDIIISENFLQKNERLTEQSFLRIEVRKKTVQGSTLALLNGNSAITRMIIDSGIRTAEKVELIEQLIELYRLKSSAVLFHSDTNEYDFCLKQIAYYQKCNSVSQNILFHYNEISKIDSYEKTHSPEKQIRRLEKIIDGFLKEKKYIMTVYSKTLFALIRLECEYLKENYENAKKLLEILYADLGNSFMAGGRTPLAARIEAELSTCALFSGNYSEAIKHNEKALALLWSSNKLNYYITLENSFYAFFYKEDFNSAEKIIESSLSEQNPVVNDFRSSKPIYFEACLLFKKKEYSHALKRIKNVLPLNKDKTGYAVGIRILRIQCLLALNRQDEASSQIENLRKYISRNQKKTFTSERYMLIVKALFLIQKRGFSGQPKKPESGLIKKLSEEAGPYKWAPRTPELIKFHEWYTEYILVKI